MQAAPERASVIGSRHALPAQEVTDEAARAYAAATCDDPSASVERGFAPPMFAVVLVSRLWRSVYQDPVLGTSDAEVLHAEQRMLFCGDIVIGAPVHARAWVTDVVGFGWGDAVLVRTALDDSSGRRLVSAETTLALPRDTGRSPDRRRARVRARGEPVADATRRFDADAPRRYADAADDHNPLHLDDEAARAAGHASRVVHGMCTLATGVSGLLPRLATDPADRLRYLRARFSRPVAPGDEVTYAAHPTGAQRTYTVTATCSGRPVLKNTWLRLATGSTSTSTHGSGR